MRGIYPIIACLFLYLAAVGAVGTIRANAVATISSVVGPLSLPMVKDIGENEAFPETLLEQRAAGDRSTERNPRALRLAQFVNPVVATGNPSVAPLKWVGMLINRAPTAKNPNTAFQCTGQFIKPNVVLTAGHCIKDLTADPTGRGYDLTKQMFVLQYQNGEGSQTYRTKCALASPGWQFPPNYASMSVAEQDAAIRAAGQHDFAMILVDGSSATGVMPYDLDWKGKWGAATRVGYPGDILNGQIVQQSHGIVFFADAIPMFPRESLPNLVAHWQPLAGFTSGSSGGAWVANYNSAESASNNFLIAVTSFQNVSFPGVEFGAYLTAAEFNPLLSKVENGCQ
jgi:hypothetical protein